MKNTVLWLACAMLLTGCASGPVIGPFSYMARQSNDDARMMRLQRGVLYADHVEAEKKDKIISAMRMGSRPEDIGLVFGVDVLALTSDDYTRGEKWKMLGAQVGDIGFWSALVYGISEAVDDDSDGGSRAGVSVSVDGAVNAPVNIGVVSGDANASNNDDNGTGTSNNDAEPAAQE